MNATLYIYFHFYVLTLFMYIWVCHPFLLGSCVCMYALQTCMHTCHGNLEVCQNQILVNERAHLHLRCFMSFHSLEENRISDEHCAALGKGLKHCTKLEHLK